MRRAYYATAIFVLGALGVAFVSCTGEPPTIYCVFENEALQGGRCLTECESRCNLERIAGCSADTCVTDCEKAASGQTNACLDASYAYWRCLRTSGEPHVTCEGDVAVFSVQEGTCETELDTRNERCPAVSDGGVGDAMSRD
jgi:hypothetical protein